MADLAGLFALIGVVGAGQASAATSGPSHTFAEATRACLNATVATGVDDRLLQAGGWDGYDIEVAESAGTSLRVYTNGRGPVLLTGTGQDSDKAGCNVLETLQPGVRFAAAVDALTTEFGAQPTKRKPAETFWVMGDKGILLSATGSTTRPAVRATVVYIAEGRK